MVTTSGRRSGSHSAARRAGVLSLALALASLFVAGTPAGAGQGPYPVSYDFMLNAIQNGGAASSPGENIWSCKPSAAHPEPVVLVHGTGGNAATNWGTYSALLA